MNYQIPASLVEESYQHVHHADSLKLLELCRLKYMESISYPNERLISEGLFLVVSSLEAAYKRELRDEEVAITCERPSVNGKALVLHQRILKARNRVLTRGWNFIVSPGH